MTDIMSHVTDRAYSLEWEWGMKIFKFLYKIYNAPLHFDVLFAISDVVSKIELGVKYIWRMKQTVKLLVCCPGELRLRPIALLWYWEEHLVEICPSFHRNIQKSS